MQSTPSSRAASMSKFRRVLSKRPSQLLQGCSISSQLQKSSVGRFQAAMQGISPLLPSVEFKLPTVIVVGGRSAGKSSVLENITKCPIFPRDPALCTKMPVKLQLIQVATEAECLVTVSWRGATVALDSKDDILTEVARIMNSVDGIVAEEVTVTICQMNIHTLVLVDLPGIQVFPESARVATTGLVSKYLSKPDTLVLCVVDATTPSLDGSTALAMVRDARKLPNTILALTKSDLVRDEVEIVERIFDRILGTSTEIQHLDGLAGCVAVANRNHRDHVNLVEADVAERCHFKTILEDPAELYASDDVQRVLRDNMTIKKLILKLDSLFHNFIVTHWKPSAIGVLTPLQEQAEAEIQKLGPSVDSLSKDGILESVHSLVDFESICTAIRKSTIQVTKHSQLGTLVNHMTHYDFGSLAWAESTVKVEDKVIKAVRAALTADKYLRPVLEAYSDVFEKNTPLKLKRFGALKQLLLTQLLPKRMMEAKVAAEIVIMDMLKKALMQLNYDVSVGDAFQLLDSGIRGCVIKHIIQFVKHKSLVLPEGFILAEDDKVQKKRTKLMDRLAKVQAATDKILNIEDALSSSSDSEDALDYMPTRHDVPDFDDLADHTVATAMHTGQEEQLITAEEEAEARNAEAAISAAAIVPVIVDGATLARVGETTPMSVMNAYLASSEGITEVAANSDELQMQAVPTASSSQEGLHPTAPVSSPPSSSTGTPVPVSVSVHAGVSDGQPDTTEHPLADFVSTPAGASAAEAAAQEARMTNSHLADSVAQLSQVLLGSPRSAAEINADSETIPISPTASVTPSVAESYMIL